MNKNINKKIEGIIVEAAKRQHIPITFPLKLDVSVQGELVNDFVNYNVKANAMIGNYGFRVNTYNELLDKVEVQISRHVDVSLGA